MPDYSTAGHVRFYYGKDDDFTFQFGLGFVALDFGFTKNLFNISPKNPVVYRVDFGFSALYSGFFYNQQLVVGLIENFSFSVSSGNQFGISEKNSWAYEPKFYFNEDLIYSLDLSTKTTISFDIGLSQVKYKDSQKYPNYKHHYKFGINLIIDVND